MSAAEVHVTVKVTVRKYCYCTFTFWAQATKTVQNSTVRYPQTQAAGMIN